MSTRSNIILVTPDNRAHQFYHHWDGYLSGVGEELRSCLVYSIGMSCLVKDVSVYEILIGELANKEDYEDENKFNLNSHNNIHGDVEFTYVIRGNDLYYVYKWDLFNKVNTYNDLIDYVCKDSNKINLTRRLTDEDDK